MANGAGLAGFTAAEHVDHDVELVDAADQFQRLAHDHAAGFAREINVQRLVVDNEVALRLRGKHKPEYTPHVDTGDFIIVTNVEKLRVTGNKAEDKMYYRHTGYPGGLYETNFNKLQAKHPERVLEKAVKGMLPKGPLGYAMIKKLKVYAGSTHPHSAQQPQELKI